jgi:hypothetical protein
MLFSGRPASCGVTLTQPWVTDEQEQGPQSVVGGQGKRPRQTVRRGPHPRRMSKLCTIALPGRWVTFLSADGDAQHHRLTTDGGQEADIGRRSAQER